MSSAHLSALRNANEAAEETLAYHAQRGDYSLVDMSALELSEFVHSIFERIMGID